jgi:uncharacterized membrane protein (UPF0127 family)
MGSSATLNRFKTRLLALAIVCAPIAAFGVECSETHVTVQGSFGEARFTVELADEPAERSKGLMHRETMASSAGMLFIYEAPLSAAFWMKNTLIPLDMIFADPTGLITHIHENAIPHDETPILGGENVLGILEINGGLSKRFGFKVGDSLVHPAFSGVNENNSCAP